MDNVRLSTDRRRAIRRPYSPGGMVANMVELVRVSRGLWRPPDTIADLGGRAAALLSCLPDDSVIADLAAAHLHGLWLPSAEHTGPLGFILRAGSEVPRAHAGSNRREVCGRRRTLRRDEVISLDGLPVTSLARTWIDLSEHLELVDLVAAGDSALRLGATVADLEEVIRRAAGRRGVIRARTALPLLDRRSRSRPESHLRTGLVLRDVVPSGVNTPVYDEHGQWLGEPDLHYAEARLAIEYNGAGHADPPRMQRDITREVDLDDRGRWLTIVVGPVQVFRRMDHTAAYIARVRRERLRDLS